MGRDTFGISDTPIGQDPDFDFLTVGTKQNPIVIPGPEQAPEKVVGDQEQAPEATQAAAPETPEVPAAQEGQEEVTTPAEGEGESLLAGKYKDVSALEQGYKEIVKLQSQTARARNKAERDMAALSEQVETLERTLQQAIPYVNQALMAQQGQPQQALSPQQQGPWGYDEPQPQQPQGPLTPQQQQLMIDNLVAQRMSGLRSEIETNMEAQYKQQETETAVYSFFEKHPEIAMGSEDDSLIMETIDELNRSWESMGQPPIYAGNAESLEIAFEASKNPELRAVLSLNPQYFDSDAGMQLARFQAAMMRGDRSITQQQAPVPASQVGQRKSPPVTERASVGGTPQGERSGDELDQAILEFRKNKVGGLQGSVFS